MAPCAKLRLVRQTLIGDPDKMTGARLSFGGCQARPGQGFLVGALRRYATVGARATRALAIGSTATAATVELTDDEKAAAALLQRHAPPLWPVTRELLFLGLSVGAASLAGRTQGRDTAQSHWRFSVRSFMRG